MRIEKIELTGFKSFSEKTTFIFHPGITCFIGPNGCGKSNIVDAFGWVLGEQSAKTLRSDRMEEVIFNGSQTKKPRGMSEVILYVSFPEDQGNGHDGERVVTVARRLYRSGESEYLINKQICRLRDIRDMFLDTGLEMRSYSVLEQGKIGEIINARPQERRFLIEEVAGVMKYKVRKAEAENKLESSRLNLQRVSDIISEVKRQLSSLDRQAKRAEKYKRAIDSLKEVELRISKREYIKMNRKLHELVNGLKEFSLKEAKKRTVITELETALQQKKLHIVEKEKEIDSINNQLQDVEKSISNLEREIAVNKSDIQHLINTAISLRKQSEEVESLLHVKKKRLEEISGKDSHIQVMIDSLKDTLLKHETGLTVAEDEIFSLEEEIDEKRRELFRVSDSLGSLRNEVNRLEVTHEGLSKRVSISQRESEEAQRRIAELKEDLKGVEGDRKRREEALHELQDKRATYNSELFERKEELENSRQEKSELREEIASLSSRIQSLKELVTGKLDRDVVQGAGVKLLASLSEVINVDMRYEKAVEAALSDKVKGFIVSSRDDIKKSVDLVKKQNLPRVAFILPEIHENLELQPIEINLQGVSYLYRFLRNENSYYPLIKSFLREYLLVDDIGSAFWLLDNLDNVNNLPHNIKIVTLNGEVVEAGGVVLCGCGSNILRLRRQIRELSVSIEGRKNELSHVDETISVCKQRMEELKPVLRELESEIVSQEKGLFLLQGSERRCSEEKERFEKKHNFINLELDELKSEITSVEEEVLRRKGDIKVEEERKASVESELNTLQEELSLKRGNIDSSRHTLTDIKVELNSYTERLKAITREKEVLGREISDLRQRKKNLIEEVRSDNRIVKKKQDRIKMLEEQLKENVSSAEIFKQTISQKRDTIQDDKEKILSDEALLKKERNALDVLSKDVHEKEIFKAELSLKISNLSNGIRVKYQVDISEADIPLTDTEEEDLNLAHEAREKIQVMGQVNLGALDEHRDLSERYEFLKNQHDDIVQSINELEEAISKISRTTRRRLKEAFESLKLKFNEVFRLLFGGGTAELSLTDESNILESGLEIIAQPPGKRLQNINLLSGGEKALAALALLFAGFLLKPAPLCILDEADAPLDESNTERFLTMLKDISRNIQFIVITHNRLTMEGADYLYGITMEEPGVSKVLSMEFV